MLEFFEIFVASEYRRNCILLLFFIDWAYHFIREKWITVFPDCGKGTFIWVMEKYRKTIQRNHQLKTLKI